MLNPEKNSLTIELFGIIVLSYIFSFDMNGVV